MAKHLGEGSKLENVERGLQEKREAIFPQNSREVPNGEMRSGVKWESQKWAVNVGTDCMSLPDTLPPHRQASDGGLFSTLLNSLGMVKTAGVSATV